MRFSWTDERVERLKALWSSDDKPSCTEIAAALGDGLTRSAVMGKVHRLDLERRGTNGNYKGNGRSRSSKPRKLREYKPKPTKFALSFNAATVTKIPVETFEERVAAVLPLHVSLMELGDHSCRFPYGDGPFTFCGHPKTAGSSYCAEHVTLTSSVAKHYNVSPEERRRRREQSFANLELRRRKQARAQVQA